ncbi:TonB-dependent receptor plug domain-containing protein [Catalinimonas niigatensis]|uniref:TonB-dependent receptor plug domain-containing protein n=1 Tax=Catalinimonas niigatensis TaxID=1397264 RepID=UPI002666F8EC|nr:TonB-dependent receptor plug domain-containing protein [Catalinimonas niigatensis]WPP49938.1 TonB-dependent receptor plug domain-containing protein [Catalinimonas niigatensis]
MIHLKATEKASALQETLNQTVGVSSKKALTLRETPGIVSTITAEDIRHLGARDMMDILQLIPGLEFGTDVEFQVGLSVRGNWANEGKILLMIDGIEINETLYQTVPFGNRFPVDQIERIEIIRGPGSAMYGGTAEYGVINIITKGDSRLNGVTVAGSYGQRSNSFARRNIGLTAGKQLGHWHIDAAMFKGEGNRSDQNYSSFYGSEVNLADGYSKMSPTFLNIGIKYKSASFRAIYDHYKTTSSEYQVDYTLFTAYLKYDYKLSRKLTLTPQFTYINHLPWHYKGYFEEDFAREYKVRGQRYKANLSASYDISRKLNVVFGGEYFNDRATDELGLENFGEGINEVGYDNYSVFTQGLFQHYFANITLGARYDYHSAFGAAFVPRVALTKRIDNFHFKLLYSQAYRAPGIENLNYTPDIKPERSAVAELELGYQFTPEMLLSSNFFHIRTRDVIIFGFDVATKEESYMNYERMGTQGMEVEYKIKKNLWNASVTYSFYQALSDNTVETYQVEGKEHLNLGIPAHKIGLSSSFRIRKSFFVSPSLVHRSIRYAYKELDEEENPILGSLEANTQLNMYLHHDNLLVDGLTLGFGVYNLLNQDASIPQPYHGGFSPIPVSGREFTLKLLYHLNFSQTSAQ